MCVLCHGLRRFGRAKLVAMGGVCTVLYALGAFRRLFGDYSFELFGIAPLRWVLPLMVSTSSRLLIINPSLGGTSFLYFHTGGPSKKPKS